MDIIKNFLLFVVIPVTLVFSSGILDIKLIQNIFSTKKPYNQNAHQVALKSELEEFSKYIKCEQNPISISIEEVDGGVAIQNNSTNLHLCFFDQKETFTVTPGQRVFKKGFKKEDIKLLRSLKEGL